MIDPCVNGLQECRPKLIELWYVMQAGQRPETVLCELLGQDQPVSGLYGGCTRGSAIRHQTSRTVPCKRWGFLIMRPTGPTLRPT